VAQLKPDHRLIEKRSRKARGSGCLLPSYLSEKGKNLATKEDIGAITEKVENTKAAVGNEVEPLRRQAAKTQTSLNEREAALAVIRDKYLDTALVRLGKIRKELEGEFRAILGAVG
jgi:hypothetical protein